MLSVPLFGPSKWASRADERSWEADQIKNGFFTHFLIETLRWEDGAKTLGDVFPVIRQRVSSAVEDKYHQKQTPSAEFSRRAATIVLAVPEQN